MIKGGGSSRGNLPIAALKGGSQPIALPQIDLDIPLIDIDPTLDQGLTVGALSQAELKARGILSIGIPNDPKATIRARQLAVEQLSPEARAAYYDLLAGGVSSDYAGPPMGEYVDGNDAYNGARIVPVGTPGALSHVGHMLSERVVSMDAINPADISDMLTKLYTSTDFDDVQIYADAMLRDANSFQRSAIKPYLQMAAQWEFENGIMGGFGNETASIIDNLELYQGGNWEGMRGPDYYSVSADVSVNVGDLTGRTGAYMGNPGIVVAGMFAPQYVRELEISFALTAVVDRNGNFYVGTEGGEGYSGTK